MKKFLPLIILLVIVICASAIVVVTQIKRAASTTTPGIIPTPSITVEENGFQVSGGQGTPSQENKSSGLNQISLKITSPVNGTVVNSSTLTVRGVTVPKAEVFVNEAETTADAAGNFVAKITLDEGENFILVTVNDADGNAAEQEFTVTYDSGV